MLRTRFTEMFAIDHPVMSAPMAMHSGGTLAAAVSAAGGMGSFGGLHMAQPPSWVTEQAALVRSQTDGAFAIGFITPFLGFVEGHFAAALDAAPAAIALSFSDPGDWAKRVRDAGLRLICQAQTLGDAELAVAAGADVLVAQGTEAGGHTGTMATLPLLTAVVERFPDVPVLAAGGIGDGATLAAALLAGADGAWLGTAFLATDECVEIGDDHKAAIVASDGGDTVWTQSYDIASGMPWPATIGVRTKRNEFTDEWDGRTDELRAADRSTLSPPPWLLYGQSARSVSAVRPAADVVRSISEDAERVLRSRPGSLLA